MDTRRLYYADSQLAEFDARVVGRIEVAGRPALLLDETAFYPTSGGQPYDTGTLNGTRVVDVIDLDDGRIAHVLENPVEGEVLRGRIDWPRRFDHMQQHTGQHVLSAAFERLQHARTESFHLGSETATIDFAVTLTPEMIADAETEANRIVWEDRPVLVRSVSAGEAANLPLRKETGRTGPLRLVEVEGFDLSACGGTHVARTGAIGIIAVTGHERFKGGTRVEFVCGARALARFRGLRQTVAGAVRQLSIGAGELPDAVERLLADAKDTRQQLSAALARVAELQALTLGATAEHVGTVRLVLAEVAGLDAAALKATAAALTAQPSYAAVLVGSGPSRLVVAARAPGLRTDAAAIVRALVATFGGKGGGRPELAQGGGLVGEAEQILAAARALVAGQG